MSAKFLLLKNAESNAELKGLDRKSLVTEHSQVSKAPKMLRGTYRARGLTNPYMCSPCHMKMISLRKNKLFLNRKRRLGKKKLSQKKLKKMKTYGPGINSASHKC